MIVEKIGVLDTYISLHERDASVYRPAEQLASGGYIPAQLHRVQWCYDIETTYCKAREQVRRFEIYYEPFVTYEESDLDWLLYCGKAKEIEGRCLMWGDKVELHVRVGSPISKWDHREYEIDKRVNCVVTQAEMGAVAGEMPRVFYTLRQASA